MMYHRGCPERKFHSHIPTSRMRNPFDTLKKIVDENHALLNVQGVDGMSPDCETKDLEGKILIKDGFSFLYSCSDKSSVF